MEKFRFSLTLTVLILSVFLFLNGCSNKDSDMQTQFKDFVTKLEVKIIPLYKDVNLAYWNAAISGKKEDFDKVADLQNKMTAIYSNKDDFKTLKKIKESGDVKDEIFKRELTVLYNYYLGNQVDTAKLNAVNKMQNDIEQKYGNYRAEVGGKKLTDNEVENVLSGTKDSKELMDVWLAHKKIGTVVADDLKKLVGLASAGK